MKRWKKKNAAARAKAANTRKAKEVLDLTNKNATLSYMWNALKNENTLPDSIILSILKTWPSLFWEIPPSRLTENVAEWVVRRDPTSFQFCGPMRANVRVALAAAFVRPKNWMLTDPSIFGNKEFVWWAIDVDLIDPYCLKIWTKDQLSWLLPLLRSEEGVMCLLAKWSQLMGWDIPNPYYWDSLPYIPYIWDSIPYSSFCPRFLTAIDKIARCKQPFCLMRDIFRKRLLLARLFKEPWQGLDVELAESISEYLTVPLVFYSIVEGGDRRYRKLCKKR